MDYDVIINIPCYRKKLNNFPYTSYHIFIIKKKKKNEEKAGEKTGHGISNHQANNKTNADRIPRKMYIIFWGSIFTTPSYVAHKHRCALPQPCSMKRDDTEIWNLWGEPSMVRAYRSPLSFDRIKYLYRRSYCGVTKFEILPTSLYLPPAVEPGYLPLAPNFRHQIVLSDVRAQNKHRRNFAFSWLRGFYLGGVSLIDR